MTNLAQCVTNLKAQHRKTLAWNLLETNENENFSQYT